MKIHHLVPFIVHWIIYSLWEVHIINWDVSAFLPVFNGPRLSTVEHIFDDLSMLVTFHRLGIHWVWRFCKTWHFNGGFQTAFHSTFPWLLLLPTFRSCFPFESSVPASRTHSAGVVYPITGACPAYLLNASDSKWGRFYFHASRFHCVLGGCAFATRCLDLLKECTRFLFQLSMTISRSRILSTITQTYLIPTVRWYRTSFCFNNQYDYERPWINIRTTHDIVYQWHSKSETESE